MSDMIKESTKLIHGGIARDKLTDAVNIPIYQTSTFAQEIPGVHKGYEYSRTGNPTREALEALTADLEHGIRGYAFASGMAAITAVLTLFKSGDRLILSDNVYGETFRVLDKVFKQFGLNYTMVDTSDISNIEKEIAPDVRAIYIETPTNPLLKITDLNAVSGLAKKNGLLTIVDNTFLTPYLQKPIDHGADIVIHSATNYLGGHSDLVAGLVVVNDKEIAERIAFIQNSTGGILGPFDSFLLIRGIRTLGVRLDRHVENAEYLADFLVNSPAVNKVYYPGLSGAQGYEVNRRQAKNGGAMISFELTNGHDMNKFFRALGTITLAESLGGVESLVCHPATMTHASIPADIRHKAGISDELIRFSVGIEDKEDLKLNHMGINKNVNLFVKLESYNPGGSVKDRVGKYMVEDAESSGLLKPGGTIIEGTAGNTGIGIAFAALNRGYKVIFVVPTKFSIEKQELMAALGAEIIHTPREDGMLGAVAKAKELQKSIPGALMMGQFTNMANPKAHYETTGPEIYRDLDGKIDYVVLGAGSGGTFSGILRYLKEKNPDIKGVLADPVGSTIGGGEHGDYNIEGIGNDFIADTMDMKLVDRVIKVNDDEAYNGSRMLALHEGIFAGSSSGAAYAAAEKLSGDIDRGNIVMVAPDRGDRYFSEHLYRPVE